MAPLLGVERLPSRQMAVLRWNYYNNYWSLIMKTSGRRMNITALSGFFVLKVLFVSRSERGQRIKYMAF
jgi:hypothetical protein